MTTPVKLATVPDAWNAEVVALLEDLLAQARDPARGLTCVVVVAAERAADGIRVRHAGLDNGATVLGYLHVALHWVLGRIQ